MPASSCGGHTVKALSTIIVAFAGVFGPTIAFADAPPAATAKAAPKVQRWTEVRVAAELREKDTAKVNVITAGEEQKSSFDRCSGAADVTLCRILVSAVNVAAIIGTNIPIK